MALNRLAILVSFLALATACGPADTGADDPDGGTSVEDSDGDTIADDHEGSVGGTDTDSDGTPDYLDDDSDGDGIPDYREAGDLDPATRPVDSDSDGSPDFRDLDSDSNDRLDALDGPDDLDGDGVGNYADQDDDGDGLLDTVELGPNPLAPLSSDDDGYPDFQDKDSDNDWISDEQERTNDPDTDGQPNYLDLDSDGDCLLDRDEAGDTDLATPPRDSDDDGRPDFLNLDSDNDGLTDSAEDANCNGIHDPDESSAASADTDGDGTTDLIESVAGTDSNSATDNPQARGDFYFVVPYEEPTVPLIDTLEFRTSIQYADIYLSFDTTGSMSAELSAMSSSLPGLISDLRCQATGGACALDEDCAVGVCFGGLCVEDPLEGAGCVPDMWTGVGTWDEIDTFRNLVALQPDPGTTAAQIPTSTAGGSEEAPLQAPACVADEQYCTNSTQNCVTTGVGCVGFRPEAIRILIQITDADNQCSGTRCSLFTAATTGAMLIAKGIRFIGLYGTSDEGGTGTAQSIASDIGTASATVNSSGTPFVYPALDAAVVTMTRQGVLDLVRGIALAVTIGAADLPSDDGNALQFIDHLEVNVSGGACTAVSPTTDTNADGYLDAFPTLMPGTPICWDVHPIAENTTVPPLATPQVFRAELTVYGDGSPLDSRQVYFLVPPVIPEIPID